MIVRQATTEIRNLIKYHQQSHKENQEHIFEANLQQYLRQFSNLSNSRSNNNIGNIPPNLLQSLSNHYGNLAHQSFLSCETLSQYNINNNTIGVNQMRSNISRDLNHSNNQSSNMNIRQMRTTAESSPELEQCNSSSPNSVNGSNNGVSDDAHRQLYEFDDDPHRKEFLDDLFSFMQKRGTAIARLPIMAKQVLDLYQLYNLVVQRGGLVEVINKKLWQEIIKGLNLPASITSAAFTLRTQYMKYLYPFEQDRLRLSTNEELQAAIDGNKRETRNKNPYPPFMDSLQQTRRSPIMPILMASAQGQHNFSHQHNHNMHLNTSNNSLLANRNFNLVTGGSHANNSLTNSNSSHASEMEARLLEYSLNLTKELPSQNLSSSFLTPQMQALIGQNFQPPLTPDELHRFSTLWSICSTGQFANMAVAASVLSATRNAAGTSNIPTEPVAQSSRAPTTSTMTTSGLMPGCSLSAAPSLGTKRSATNDEPQNEALNLSEPSLNNQESRHNFPTTRTNGHRKRSRLNATEEGSSNPEQCLPMNIRILRQDDDQVHIRMEIGDREYVGILECHDNENEDDEEDDLDDVEHEDGE